RGSLRALLREDGGRGASLYAAIGRRTVTERLLRAFPGWSGITGSGRGRRARDPCDPATPEAHMPRAARCSCIALILLVATASARPALAVWPHDPNFNLRVAPTSAYQTPGGIVADGAGGVIIAWEDSRGADKDIYAQHITATGVVAPGWPASGLAICTASGEQFSVRAVSDGAGGAILAWTDRRAVTQDDIFAMRVRGDGTFPGGWPVNGRQLLADSHQENTIAIISDGAGGAEVAWNFVFGVSDIDIYGARVDPSGNVLW